MVSKIIRIGNQIVSVGGDVLSAPNPELEVNQTIETSEISGLISTDVTKGDILIRREGVGDFVDEYTPEGFNYRCKFFVRDGELRVVSINGSTDFEYWDYDVTTSSWKGLNRVSSPSRTRMYSSIRSYDKGFEMDDEGRLMYITGHHLNQLGRGGGFLHYEEEPHYWTGRYMPLDLIDYWPKPEEYNETYPTVFQRQVEGTCSFYHDGKWHLCYGYQPQVGYTEADVSSDFGGNSNFTTFTYEPSSDTWTPTTHDGGYFPEDNPKGCAMGVDPNGDLWLVFGCDQAYVASWTIYDASDIPTGNYITLSFYKWNPATSNWDWQFFNGDRTYATEVRCNFKILEDGTWILERGSTGASQMHLPLKYNSTSNRFEMWGSMDLSATTYPPSYCNNRVFIANDNYYLVYAGAVRKDRTDLTGNTSYNGDSALKNSFIKVAKYNESLDKWEKLDTEFEWYSPRNADGANVTNTQYCFDLDLIKHNGEIHIVGVGPQYSEESIKFWKFDADTETVYEYPKPYYPAISTREVYTKSDDITQSGITYRVIACNEYPYMRTMEWDGSSWTADQMMDYPDRNLYVPKWYETSSGDLYVFAGHNDTAEEIALFYYDKTANPRQLKRVAFGDWFQGTPPVQYPHNGLCLYESASGVMLITQSANNSEKNIYKIQEDASGVPYAIDFTGVTLPTYAGGTVTVVEGAGMIVWDGKFWLGHSSYNPPYRTEMYSWDGSSSTFTEHSLSSVRVNWYDMIANNQGYLSRSRTGMGFLVHDNTLWAFHSNDGYPYFHLWKYDSSDDAFHEELFTPFPHSSTPLQRFINRASWNDKLYLVTKSYQGQGVTMQLVEYTGSGTPKLYPLLDIPPKMYPEAIDTELLVQPDGNLDLIIHPANRFTGRGQRVYRINQDYLDAGARHWGRAKEQYANGTHYSNNFGIALESGSKGDTIRIQRYKP